MPTRKKQIVIGRHEDSSIVFIDDPIGKPLSKEGKDKIVAFYEEHMKPNTEKE